MAQFDIHRLPSAKLPQRLMLDIQNNHFSLLASRLVIPLLPARAIPQPINRLNPVFQIGGDDYALTTQEMTAVPKTLLGPIIGSLRVERDAILGALDFLVIGY